MKHPVDFWLCSFRRIATVEQLQLEQTHTHGHLYRIPPAATPRGIKIARIGRGKHQKAWKQEFRREHNSNPLQRHSHVHFRETF